MAALLVCAGVYMGRSRRFAAWSAYAILFLLLLPLASCDVGRPVGGSSGATGPAGSSQGGGVAGVDPGATPIDLATCTRCHGDASRGNAAPPLSLKGTSATADLGVGAHQQHLAGLSTRAPLRCDECHLVPLRSTDPGHMDGPLPVVRFDAPNSTGLARAQGASPAWDRTAQTCSGVYCHGATLSAGGASTSPIWTRVDGSQMQCSSCHGFPPPAPHPSSTTCASCHPATVDALGNILLSGGKHIDGVVEVSGGACTTCHGDATRPEAVALYQAAPPSGPHGELSPTDLAVGAHQAHLHDGPYREALSCESCHLVPTDLSHVDGVGRVAFGGDLGPKNAGATWNPSSATCSSTYCHGATLSAGGANTSPRWTGGPSEAQCNSCHALPSSNPSHPPTPKDLTTCSSCHPGTVDAAGNILVAAGKHIDGNVDVNAYHPVGWGSPDQHGAAANRGLSQCQQCHGTDLTGGSAGVSCDSCHTGGTAWRTSCTFCHGDATRSTAIAAAPPQGVAGETATTARGVGAHQSHLSQGPLARAIACSECHTVPASALDARHVNDVREITFGTLSKAAGAVPSYDAQSASCASTYCHGATLNGGDGKTPAWTGTFTAGATTLGCGSCHGNPPATSSGAHTKVTSVSQCATCHPDTVTVSGAVNASGGFHVNGTVERKAYHPAGWGPSTGAANTHAPAANQGIAACASCHGDLAGAGGYVDVACASCHKAGGTANDFGTTATPSCTGCHGGTLTGTDGAGFARAPAPPRATLGSSRPAGAHAKHLTPGALYAAGAYACSQCHASPSQPLHASGSVDMAWGATASASGAAPSFNAAANTCASTYCHGSFSNGNNRTMTWTDTGTATCGSCHGLPPAGTHPAIAATQNCSGCHPAYSGLPGGAITILDATKHMNGVIDSTAAHAASAQWADPSQHGLRAIDASYTAGQGPQACVGCHVAYGSAGTPTAAGVATTSCNTCHAAAGHASWTTECTFCHGGQDNATGAPARDHLVVRGTAQPTTQVTVGAHTSHVAGTHGIDAALACTDCHDVNPAGAVDSTLVPGHIDGASATVVFGATGKLGGAVPAWNRTAATCASTYCHGATLNATTTRGPNATPAWTTVNGSQTACGSCHQSPPGTANHHNAAAMTTCNRCHAGTVDATGKILLAGNLHIDGTVQNTVTGCTACHGGTAPPAVTGQDVNVAAAPTGSGAPDTYGATATNGARVGVHLAHVGGSRSRPVLCNACHVVPTQPVHKTGVATAGAVTFANLATTGGKSPTYAGAGGSCSATYCHGNFTGGAGSSATPAWTAAGALGCASCHGDPPSAATGDAAHPQNGACSKCHAGYSDNTASPRLVNATTHVDGKVDYVALTCTTCHGGANGLAGNDAAGVALTPAPPATATGASPESVHAKHLAAGALSGAFNCAECHASPSSPLHANGAVGFAWGPLATKVLPGDTRTVAPAYSASSNTCSNTYCHGNFKNGNAANAPAWTNGAPACGSCHALPPAGTHPAGASACGNCHTGYTATTVNAATHVNGVVETNLTCTSCHGGTLTGNDAAGIALAPAPPVDASAAHNSTTTSPGVGAHAAHLKNTVLRGTPINCGECHATPTSTSHSNGAVDFAWGPLATNKGAITTVAFNAASNTCSNTYCHGNFAGGAKAAPAWTGTFTAGATTLACASCHGDPPSAATGDAGHPQNYACSTCHAGYADRTAASRTVFTVNATAHVNGTVDYVALTCTSCHGTAGRTGADANVAAAPPADTAGNTAATARGVGAHLAHVAGTRSKQVLCSECHSGAVPTAMVHANGTATVSWGTLATTGNVTPSYSTTALTCSASYCHGNFTGGAGTAASPAWTTAGALACTSCHGNPPALPHPQDTACADCHGAGYSQTTVVASTHVDGTVTLAATRTGCTQCHGDGARAPIAGADASTPAAPPIGSKGETATTARAVGAHQAHLNQKTFRANPIACSECHAVPAAGDKAHANGTAAVAFGSLARTGGITAAAWNGTSLTCASTYCHGNFKNGAVAAPSWAGTFTAGASTLTCASCHGNPPAGTHPTSTTCSQCHTGYADKPASGPQAVNLTSHMNGAVDVANLTCTSCHGNASVVAVAGADANVKAAPPVDSKGNSVTTAQGVGVHQVHVNGARSKPVACAECHSGAVPTSTTHSDGTVQVAFGALAKTVLPGDTRTVSPVYAGAGGSCSASYCHGNFSGGLGTAATPAWTAAGTLGCNACHGSGTGATANPPPVPHPQNTACGSCHSGYTSTTVNAATHVNGVVDQTGTGCTQCHGTPGRTTYAAEAPPIDSKGNSAITSRGVGAHQTHLTAGGLSNAIACTECHVVPAAGDKTHANGTAAVTFGTLAKTGSVTPAWSPTALTCASVYCHGSFTNGTTANAPSWTGTGQAACGTCHGIPPAGSHPTLTAGTNCGGCHTGYSATPGSTNGTVNLANHVNGKVDVTGGESAGGTNCGGCHSTIFSMMNGTVAKVTKHTLASDVPTDSGGTWSGNLKTAPPYASASCVSTCHSDHPHAVATGGTHEYNVYLDANARSLTSSTSTRSRTDFDSAQTNGGLCISCHQNPVDASHPAISKSGYQGAAHNFTSNTAGTTTYTWQYTLHDNGAFQRNCTKCHASQAEGDSPTVAATGSGTVGPHASDFGSLLAGTTNPNGAPANFVCYNCHGNATTGKDMSAKDIATDAAKAQGHGGKINADAKHVTSTEDAATWNSGAYSGTNRHANCLDCHDTHLAGKVKHTPGPNDGAISASSPLNGVSGVGYTTTLPTNFAATGSANLQKVNPATAEYQVCFKCHTSWAFGATPPTGTSTLAETDLAQEFNPNNASAHPVVNTLNNQTGSLATKALAASQLLAPWNATPGNQTMTCTDCHNTDAASPAAQGPHGSAITFMLAGANKAWPYTVAGATSGTLRNVASSETNLGSNNGLFCRNCHPQQNSAASNALHRLVGSNGSQHSSSFFTCLGCHIRIPHGGKVSRLIVTTNAPARYKQGAPSTLTMTRFQKTAKDSYGWNQFGRSCAEHGSGLASGEAW